MKCWFGDDSYWTDFLVTTSEGATHYWLIGPLAAS